ncbi:MAG TPA: transcription antitermination factor NusB [Nocardioidaceae bacterium]|nr:transcription antitermination factor NusB [Nocardioidaceae bacterium]
MTARTKARKRALDILFECDARDLMPEELLGERIAMSDPPVNDYTAFLVRGVSDNIIGIDDMLANYSEGWSLERMPAVDRNMLRIGVFEILYVDELPDAVAVSEAVNMVRDLSTDESPAFVNGILGNVVRHKSAPLDSAPLDSAPLDSSGAAARAAQSPSIRRPD